MALSDSCAQFLRDVGEASRRLAEEAHWYSAPTNPIDYGPEVDALRRAAAKVAYDPDDVAAGGELLKLALSVRQYLDTHPEDAEVVKREEAMKRLVLLIQGQLSGEDALTVPVVVKSIASDSPEAGKAAGKLKEMLSKLGKPTYDLAIKIIGDVASAAVKKVFGL